MSGKSVRASIAIRGAVQGVGFRPFVYRLAVSLGLTGSVRNSTAGVWVEAEGEESAVEEFLLRLEKERPPLASIQSLEARLLDPVGLGSFTILPSEESGEKGALVLPDVATCSDCLHEVFDPRDRRHLYPFTNCTACGPRYTIILALPYDRARTTMKKFPLCEECRREYEDPRDRRFHAEPNACPRCGPSLELWDRSGKSLARAEEALRLAADAVRGGRIVALKGLGGFHLIVDARDEAAVTRLRERKRREEKPLAIMAPSIEAAREVAEVSAAEERLLFSPEAPIVLLLRKEEGRIAPSVAPRNPALGVMLPYTALHHILLRDLGFPIVATSGNLSDEPICFDEKEALSRLGDVADLFLVHDRPIERHVDDSVARVVLGRELVLRRARGYAPLPFRLKDPVPDLLAVGAHLKNAVAVARGTQVFLGPHIGDLDTAESREAFLGAIRTLSDLQEIVPERVACDLHPDYVSTAHAESLGRPLIRVQHHHAHILACMAENEISGKALGVAWDGTGYGTDGSVWGGEFLLVAGSGYRRVGSLRSFRLPGGEAAVREPRRSAFGLLYEMLGEGILEREDLPSLSAFTREERALLARMLARGVLSPLTTSAGRLFDAVASILGIRQRMSFEGQAAMELEYALARVPTVEAYPFRLIESDGRLVVDWEPIVRAILEDAASGRETGAISARFHNALAEAIVATARAIGEEAVVLSGGCWQNAYLLTRTVRLLRASGLRPYWHQRVPPNDGGIALGQAAAALAAVGEER